MSITKKLVMPAALAALVGSTSFASAATEINWWHGMGGTNGDRINKMAEDFNASQSDYKVVPTYKGNYSEVMTGAIAAFRAKQQPHIVQVFEVGTATMMAAKGAIYPVEKMMNDAGVPFDKSDYLPAVVSYYQTPEGELLSMPFNSSTPVMWYNKDAFKKAGVAKVPETWNEVKDASDKLRAAGYKCGFSFGWQSWVMIETFGAWHNSPMSTRENGFAGLDVEFTFNNDLMKKHFNNLASWSKDGTFAYGGRRGDSLPMFVNQECGIWMNTSAYYGALKTQAKFDFGQAMLPYYDDVVEKPQNSIIGGATLWVLQGHDKEEYKGVAEFMKYLSSPDVQAWWHQETGYVPITNAAYELSKKQGFYEKNPGTDIAIQQLSLNEPTSNSRGVRFGNFVQIRDVINEEMEAIWSGDKTAEQGLDDAVKRGNDLLRKFEKANK
ncbi:sn-glycerol-3-phosphate ABC transporter substrate-binding protein UgpB [Sneathiella chinensis]|uniref:sn-glycerol-3-phosphate-binding periplasmic protein UgpB n=1 Tax=Sneathiella chinensis TaxID=349750 RepID=A0ABQ5U372_9PROT|nr:sn-glycerol-3-phosphate ABC transporter substrate-binding protein UgpB [Sneathiella chinensis]GLQ06095.1 ABC transporter substrate-binding protein [Sneathiella chinensis]